MRLNQTADAILAGRWTGGAKGHVFGAADGTTSETAWENAVTEAKLSGLHCHDLRHSYASWPVERGRTLKEVQDALGHRTVTMTNRYAHVAPEHLREAVGQCSTTCLPTSKPFETASVLAQASARKSCSRLLEHLRSSCCLLVRLAGIEPATFRFEV